MASYAETSLIRALGYLSEAQQAITHNLANVSSHGFKRRMPTAMLGESRFHSMLQAELPAVGYTEATDWSPGNLVPTGQPTHVALDGPEFFRVRTQDGRTYLTRNGQLHVDSGGYLSTPAGYRYLDSLGREIQVRSEGGGTAHFSISPDGSLVDSDTGVSLGRGLGLFRVDAAESLLPAGTGLYVETTAEPAPAVPAASVRQGNLEASNVSSIDEMIGMLVVQRSFQATATALRTVSQLRSSFVNALDR